MLTENENVCKLFLFERLSTGITVSNFLFLSGYRSLAEKEKYNFEIWSQFKV